MWLIVRACVGIAAIACLAACQTTTANTPSGRPEITLQGVKPERVKPQIVNAMINQGARLKSDSAYQLTFERPWGQHGAVIGALLSADGSGAIERLTFSITDSGGGSRVVLDRSMVLIRGFGREDATPAGPNPPGMEPSQEVLEKAVAQAR